MTIAELIARLEKATGPDRDLDLEIGEFVGAANHSGPAYHRPFRDWAKHYTASIDAALTLVPEGWQYQLLHTSALPRCSGKKYYASIAPQSDCGWTQGEHHDGDADTLPLAICIAALKAGRT